jgi:hypothetical protein
MDKNFYILIFYFFMVTLCVNGQQIENITWTQQDEQIIIKYDVTGAKYFEKFDITLFVSTDGGLTYSGPLKEVTGDIGANIGEGKNKSITWNVLDEYPGFGGNIVFDVRAVVSPQKVKHKIIAGYKGSLSAPYGLMAGLTGKVGFYLSSRFNYGYFTSPDYETNGQSITGYNEQGYYSFVDGEKIRRLSLTGGLLIQLGWRWHLYLGGGLADYDLLWRIAEYDFDDNDTGTSWVKHTGESFRSAEAEAGVLFNFYKFYIGAGVTSPGFHWVEGTVAAGVLF